MKGTIFKLNQSKPYNSELHVIKNICEASLQNGLYVAKN